MVVIERMKCQREKSQYKEIYSYSSNRSGSASLQKKLIFAALKVKFYFRNKTFPLIS